MGQGRAGVRFVLAAGLGGLAEKFPGLLRNLNLQMSQVLIAGAYEGLEPRFQRTPKPGGGLRQPFDAGCKLGLRTI